MLDQLMYRLGLFKIFEKKNHSLYEHLQNTLEIRKMSIICDFDRILKIESNLQHFTRNCRWFWKRWGRHVFVESRTFEYEGERNDHMLHCEQVFGNIFERRESKCCGVLMKHCRNFKNEQVITLQMAQQLKTRKINVIPGQLFCRLCKAKFLLETESLYWWPDKVQSATDTNNEFIEYQTLRKKLQSIGISPVTWHFTFHTHLWKL